MLLEREKGQYTFNPDISISQNKSPQRQVSELNSPNGSKLLTTPKQLKRGHKIQVQAQQVQEKHDIDSDARKIARITILAQEEND